MNGINVNEVKKECESNYLVLNGNESKIVTFLTDGEKKPFVNKKKGNTFFMREFDVRTEDGKIKKLSFFSKDLLKLIEIVLTKLGKSIDEVENVSLIDKKVKLVQTLDDETDKTVLDFQLLDLEKV